MLLSIFSVGDLLVGRLMNYFLGLLWVILWYRYRGGVLGVEGEGFFFIVISGYSFCGAKVGK